MMHGEINLDGEQIGQWTIKRRSLLSGDKDEDDNKAMTYEWRVSVMSEDGTMIKKAEGTVMHIRRDGAIRLLSRTFFQMKEALPRV